MTLKQMFCVTAVATTAFFSVAAQADPATSKDMFTAAEQSEIHKILVKYLYDNPQVLTMMQQRLQQISGGTQPAGGSKVSADIDRKQLENGPSDGAADAPVTVVEFFDYNCGYCKKAGEFIKNIHVDYKPSDIRVVFREYPILSEGSRIAARYALAAHFGAPEIYMAVHNALMGTHTSLSTEADVQSVLTAANIDVDKLQSLLAKVSIQKLIEDELRQNSTLGRQMGVTGTPSFIVGDDAVKGANIPVLKSLIDEKLVASGS